MSIRFWQQVQLLDERSDDSVRTLVHLGGYCTVEQAQKLGLANSPPRVVAHLAALKKVGFLLQIAHYQAAGAESSPRFGARGRGETTPSTIPFTTHP